MANFGSAAPNSWSQDRGQYWQSNRNPSFQPASSQSHYHSGIENVTEDNTNSRKSNQLPNANYQSGHIEEVKHNDEDEDLREERFTGIPFSSKSSFSGNFGSASPFFVEIKRYLNLAPDMLPSKNPTIIPIIVEKAVQGIIDEGKQIGKEQKAEKLASKLSQKKDAGMEEIWKQCVYIYTSTNFVYKSLNSIMKSVADKEQENVWRSKVTTLGPFCLLLLDDPFTKNITKSKTIYRGANMEAAQIAQYAEMAKNKNSYQTFQTYISSTRNRKRAKALGNALFIMEVLNGFIMDLSPYSKYPKEEEELITPGVCFRVKSVIFDQKKNRNVINLELRQKIPLSVKVPVSAVPPKAVTKKHIFFAYAEDNESDASMVEKLKKNFDQRRFRVYNPRQNEDINTQIANGIEKAAVVFVFSSLAFETSKSGSKLLNYADQTKTPILNVKIYEDFQPMHWLGAILAPVKSCSPDFDEIIQSLIAMGIKTRDLVLERGENNEPQPIEEYLFQGGTKSGNLKASYYHSGKECPMKFKFLGLKDGKVFGQGDDKIGVFTLSGEYEIEDDRNVIKMQKQYVGRESITYRGKISFQELNCMIEGKWKMGEASDKFFMRLTLPRPYTKQMETTQPRITSRRQGSQVMISYCPCQYDLAQKITKGLIAKNIPAVCPPLKVHDMIKIAAQKASVVVPLMSQAYEASNIAKYVLSYVDEAGIPIVPVKAEDKYTQSGWLGVICAGALWVQMTNTQEFDKNLEQLIAQLQSYVTDSSGQEEPNEILVDEEFLEGYYMKSDEEVPLEFDVFSLINGYIAGGGEDDVGCFVINGEYSSSPDAEFLNFEFTLQYIGKDSIEFSGTITEEDSVLIFDGKWSKDNLSDIFHLEAPLFESSDSENSHVMLSYQWDSQKFVKKIADRLKQKKIPIWFDIAGDMKGNINSAMANGVQGSAIILSFDTLAYSKSVNCQKEFTYANQLQKTIVPVLLEDEKNFQDTWLGKAISALEKVNMENENQVDPGFDALVQRIEKALEQDVDDDADEPAGITRFEGGAVKGKYFSKDQSFEMAFEFFSLIEGRVSGQGIDNNVVFTMAGSYDNEGNVNFRKQYVSERTVEYNGILQCDEFGGFRIEGKWTTTNATGNFYVQSIDVTESDTTSDSS